MRVWKQLRMGAAATTLALGVQLFGSLALGPGADAQNTLVQATTRVHVRTQPTTSSTSLTILDPGEQVTATGTTNGWTKVTWNGRTAYVYSKYLTSSSSTQPVVSSTSGSSVTTANLNVRTGPSLTSSVVAVASKGTTLTRTGKVSGSYTQVTWKGEQRWVATRYLTSSTSTSGTTKTEGSVQATVNLNVRTGPSTSYSRVATMPKGTIVAKTGNTSNSFTEIVYQGQTRWVASRYLRTVSDSSTSPSDDGSTTTTTKRWATTALNIWYASTGSRYSGELPKGTELAVTGTIENGRAEIVYNGAKRWVTSRYTTSTNPNSSDSSSSSGDWDLTSPPITGGLRGTALNKGYSSGMHRTNSYIQRISADAWERFPEIKTHYGWREDVTPDHPAGRAVDFMIPDYKNNKALGTAVANYYRKYAEELNIEYIIWDQKIWSVQRDSEGWRAMADRGSDTANHLDHVHVNSN